MAGRANYNYVRVTAVLDPSEAKGFGSESLWAEPLGSDRYRIRNSPFFAYGISTEDIVIAKLEDQVLKVQNVILRGNHSTYRLKLNDKSISNPMFLKYWAPLQVMGCTFEEGPVLSVDVPPHADIYAVYDRLVAGEIEGVWDFEEGHCGHVKPQTDRAS